MFKKSFAIAILISGYCALPGHAQVPTAAQDTAAAEAQYAQAMQAQAAVTATMPTTMMSPSQVAQTMTTLQTQLATGQPLTAPVGVTMTMQSNFIPSTTAAGLVSTGNVNAAIGASAGGVTAGIATGGLTAGVSVGANGVTGSIGFGTPTAAAAGLDPPTSQYDPSSYIPFQTTEQQTQVQTNGGTITVDSNVITGTYTNPADPGPTSIVNGLPQTNLDSFVYEAGGQAELIYGDEGVDSIPPYFEFDQTHRINAGITGLRAQGLSTGHSSLLPNAWGGDEFVKTEPWTMSGNGEDIGANGQLVPANPNGNANTNPNVNVNLNVGGVNINGNVALP